MAESVGTIGARATAEGPVAPRSKVEFPGGRDKPGSDRRVWEHGAVVRVAIVGHRDLGGARTRAFVADASHGVLSAAQLRSPRVAAVSALAEGADSIFAEAALALGIPLRVVRPFSGYEADFADLGTRRRYEELRDASESEERLPYPSRSQRAYKGAMWWVVQNSDLLVAAWDGRPGLGPGGTADAVQHAIALGREVTHIDVKALDVRTYGGLA
jgi:hypothetical protein